jgi:hypothetical protein
MIKKITLFQAAIVSLFLLSCEPKNTKSETPIAEVGSKKLYMSDIREYFSGLAGKDSLTALVDYVNRWSKNQVVLQRAETYLPDNEKDLTVELETYRASLLVHKYEQMYIREKMDTAVGMNEIEQFYKDNADNFKPPGIMLKALFIKIPNDYTGIDKIRQLYRSDKEKDVEELSKTVIQGAEIYTNFNDQLVDFSEIVSLLPGTGESYENQIIKRKYIEDSDDKYTYFVKSGEIIMKEAVVPLEHVRANIVNIILNHRKTELIRQMENEIYGNAINNNEIKINIK